MSTELEIATIAASVTAAGWLITHALQAATDERRRRDEALLRFTERQLEELYGPLALLVIEGRRTIQDLKDAIGRQHIFRGQPPLSKEELATWLFWSDNDFIPRNQKIKDLLTAKTHLIDSTIIPPSFVAFLDHHNSWIVNHLRWQQDKTEYSWHSKIPWPQEFEKDVLVSFERVKQRHSSLIQRLARNT
jgi:hypothetical protein